MPLIPGDPAIVDKDTLVHILHFQSILGDFYLAVF